MNARFAAFVKATGYRTVAEQRPDREAFPGAAEENLVAGSVVFSPLAAEVSLDDKDQWGQYIKGANWKHPEGAGSTIEGKDNYPVVQIAWEDANACAKWAGKRLPSEAEWEFAARGGKSGALYAWGNQFRPDGRWMANIFQENFLSGTSPSRRTRTTEKGTAGLFLFMYRSILYPLCGRHPW